MTLLKAPATRRTGILLVIGDLISFMVFATIGRLSHGEAAGLSAVWATLRTAAPFMLAWLIVAPLLGAYDARLNARPGAMARRTALVWLAAWPLALLLRALDLQTGIPRSFAIVAGLSNLVLLVGWRSLFAWIPRRQ